MKIVNEQILMSIGKKVQEIRMSKGFSQRDFYNKTNIHVGRIEQGKINITVLTLVVICQLLGVKLWEFFKALDL